MYSTEILTAEIGHLISKFNIPILRWYIKPIDNNRNRLSLVYNDSKYGTIRPSLEITQKGEIYNPVFIPSHLTYIFDWLNRIGYDYNRQYERTQLYKKELIYKN